MGGGGGGGGGMGVGTLGGTVMSLADPLDLLGTKSSAGLSAQADAANAANATQAGEFNQIQQNETPYLQAGNSGLQQLQAAMPSLTQSFGTAQFQQDPGYQFQMQQGMQALQQSAAAGGSLNSGGTMKAISQYSQGLASQDYNNAFNRYMQTNQQNYNMLSGLANYGQNANSTIAGAGQNYANQVSSNQIGMGNATASADVGSANRLGGLVAQGAGAGVGAAVASSDERLKTNIIPISKEEISELKSTIKAYRFNYKSEEYGKGDWIGVMAQDLEKSKLGRTLVSEDENGFKQLDLRKVMSLFLATMAAG